MHNCAGNARVRCEWDSRKAAQSLRKHGVDVADAIAVLDEDHALTFEDTTAEGETRLVSLGADPFGIKERLRSLDMPSA